MVNQGSKNRGCCIAVQFVKPSEANLLFVILSYTNKYRLSLFLSLQFVVRVEL